jgi:APA family basic amino acid/polyamine antiporter
MSDPPATTGPAKPASGNQLLRVLDVTFGVAVILGSTIGVGILRLPGMVAGELRNYWLILLVWVLGGTYALLGSFSVTELGTMLPQAGGFYVYARRALGGFAGFAAGWGDWLNNCAAVAYGAFAAAGFSLALFPRLPVSEKTIALSLVAAFALLHWAGLRLSSVVQKIVSSATALALIFLAAACFLLYRGAPAAAHAVSTAAPAAPPVTGALSLGFFGMLAAVVVALRAVIVTYDGWYAAIYFTEENRNPARDFPRSMIGGVLIILALYLFLNLAFLHVLPIPRLAASQLPAADAAQILFAGWSGRFITLLSLLTLLGLINSVLLGATRIIFAIGRDGLFLKSAGTVSPGGTPRPAMLFSAAAAAVLVATGTFNRIVAIAAIIMVANYCACYVSMFVLRRREPDLPRPFRAWGYPWTTAVVLVGSILFLIAAATSDSRNAAYAGALLAACLPAYALMKRRNRPQTG